MCRPNYVVYMCLAMDYSSSAQAIAHVMVSIDTFQHERLTYARLNRSIHIIVSQFGQEISTTQTLHAYRRRHLGVLIFK